MLEFDAGVRGELAPRSGPGHACEEDFAALLRDPMFRWIRGKMGKIVYRLSHNGEVSAYPAPDMSKVIWSQAQETHRWSFPDTAGALWKLPALRGEIWTLIQAAQLEHDLRSGAWAERRQKGCGREGAAQGGKGRAPVEGRAPAGLPPRARAARGRARRAGRRSGCRPC